VGAFLYLAAGPFMLLLAEDGMRQNHLRTFLMNFHPVFACMLVVSPLIAAILPFRHMHSKGASAVMRALPVTKGTMFGSDYLSGLILAFAPIFLVALGTLPFLEPGFAHFAACPADVNLYFDPAWYPDFSDLILWLADSVVTVLFVFSVAVFAGVIAGNTAMHLLLAGLLNCIAGIIFAVTFGIVNRFFYGFSPDVGAGMESFLHPLAFLMTYGGSVNMAFPGKLDALILVVYAATAIIVSVGACILCRAVKAERAGDPVVFRGAAYIVTFLVTFVGMSAGGFLFCDMLEESQVGVAPGGVWPPGAVPVNFYVGAFLGAAISLLLTTMVLRRTFKVFNARTLKDFGCFALVAAVFLTLATTDVTGFERRIPDAREIKSATAELISVNVFPYQWNFVQTVLLTDREDIAALTALHRDILDKADAYGVARTEPYASDRDAQLDADSFPFPTNDFYIQYEKIGGFGLRRSYTVEASYPLTVGADAFGRFAETRAYKQSLSLANMAGYENLTELTLCHIESQFGPVLSQSGISDKNGMIEFAKCLDADFETLDFDDMKGDNQALMTFLIEYRAPKAETDESMRGGVSQVRATRFGQAIAPNPVSNDPDARLTLLYSITDKYERSVAWLKERGYYDGMIKATAELVREAEAEAQIYG
jgi:hypothetical protein